MSSSAGPRDGDDGEGEGEGCKMLEYFPGGGCGVQQLAAGPGKWCNRQRDTARYLHSIYTVSTQYLQYPHRQPGVSWSRWAHRCTRAAHTGWRAHTHSSVTRDSAEEQLSVSVTRPHTSASVTCHEAVSRSCHDGDRGPGLPAGPLPPRVARHAAPAAQAAALLAQ